MDNLTVSTKKQAIDWIHSLKPLGIKPGLKRMEWMMERLAHPERRVNFVHVAGTNGKGSTVSFLSNVLIKSGYKVGSFTSPYLIDFTNRIQLNGQDIADEHLVTTLNQIMPLAVELGASEWGAPTEFEVITALAILYYATIVNPDIVIWETGLGGRLDSTNIVIPIISVITNIGYDHMDLLGNDIKDIAKEKAGIIKTGIPLISAVENIDALKVIKDVAKEKKSSIYQINEQYFISAHNINGKGSNFTFRGPYLTMPDVEISMIGPHQIKNAATSLMVLEVLRQFYAFYIDEDAVYSGMKYTKWPGRFEVLAEKPTIIIDGAHNPEGAESLKATVSLMDYNRLIIVTGILGDKAIKGFYQVIASMPDKLMITEPDNPRAAKLQTVVEIVKAIDDKLEVIAIKDWQVAVNEAIKQANPDDLVIITGSLYLIADVRRFLLEEKQKVLHIN